MIRPALNTLLVMKKFFSSSLDPDFLISSQVLPSFISDGHILL